jgi:transcriptional regulator with XRE-family HTH domain
MKNKRGRPSGSYSGETNGSSTEGLAYILGNARKSKGLSLKHVANGLGVSVQFVSNIEHGRVPLPSKHVVGISEILNLRHTDVAALSLEQRVVYKRLKTIALTKEIA